MGKLTQSTECHQSKCDRVLVLHRTRYDGREKVNIVRNVGANGIRPHDIIEVIRFLYLSPREDSPLFVYINYVNEPYNLDDKMRANAIRPYIRYILRKS
jgi:hypothetical protein